jgi:hypothetical protein
VPPVVVINDNLLARLLTNGKEVGERFARKRNSSGKYNVRNSLPVVGLYLLLVIDYLKINKPLLFE